MLSFTKVTQSTVPVYLIQKAHNSVPGYSSSNDQPSSNRLCLLIPLLMDRSNAFPFINEKSSWTDYKATLTIFQNLK